MQFDFIGMQKMYLSLAREDAGPLAEALHEPAAAAAGEPVGHLRPQPRRAHPRQADRRRAPGGVRRLRPRARDAGLRPRPASAGCRRCWTATRAGSGWSTACCSPCPARRCCSTARRSGWARTSAAGDRMAVRTPMQWSDEQERRVLHRARGPAARASCPRAASRPSTSTSPTSERDPDSLLNFIRAGTSATATAPSSAGATFEVLEQPHAAVLAHRVTWDDARMVALHNLVAGAGHRAADAARPASRHALVDLLGDGIGRARPARAGRAAARGVRLPLAAGHSSGFPTPPLVPPPGPSDRLTASAGECRS